MTRHYGRLLAAAALLTTIACSEESLSVEEGSPSTLTVRVYVDADGSGAFEAGVDVPVASITVAAENGATTVTGPTGADGVATLELTPGTYSLSITGSIPAGAILATATNPIVEAPFQGGPIEAEFRHTFVPGSLTGVIYRDDSGNGQFDTGLDAVAGGVQIDLYFGTDTSGNPDTTIFTDATGAFAFGTVRTGDNTLVITPFPTIQIVGGNNQLVTVPAQGTASVEIQFTGSLVASMSDVRAATDGDIVAAEGVITWQNQWDARIYFLQDETAGISVFDGNGPTLTLGDSVLIVGQRASFRGEIQINNVTVLTILANVGEPAARVVTGAEINSGIFQGQLATIDATADSLTTDGFDNQTVWLTDGNGDEFIVFSDARTGVMPTDWVLGSPYSVTGVLGTDDRVPANFPLPNRLEVRGLTDLVQGSSTIPLATARPLNGQEVVVEGVVTWQQQWDDRQYFFQDETAGIAVFDGGSPTLTEGDRIRMTGTIGAFRGEVQISPSSAVQVLGNEAVPLPRVVTGAQVNAGSFQGELVTITATVDSLFADGFDNQTVWLTDGNGDELIAFSDSRNGTASTDWTIGADAQVTGVLGTDDRVPGSFPLPNRIEVRSVADIQTATTTETLLAARGMLTQTVTIRAVVTWQAQWDSRQYFLQDGTAGIAAFDGGSPTLEIGQVIEVTGSIGEFRGETQISPSGGPTVIGFQGEPTPRVVTGAEINLGSFQGELIQIDATVDSLTADGFDNATVWLTDGNGANFIIFNDSRNGVASTDFVIGAPYTIVGVLGTDDRVPTNFPLPFRIETRSIDDLIFGGIPVTLATARGLAVGTDVTVEGVVSWQTGWDDRVYFFQDATGGISVFQSGAPTLPRGTRIKVVGTTAAFRGETQVSPDFLQVIGQEAPPDPRTVTAAEINAGQFQGELVTITATVDSLFADGFDNQTVWLTDGNGDEFIVFSDSRNGTSSLSWTIGVSTTVLGVLGTDDRVPTNFPLPNRIETRDPADIQ